MRRDPRTSEPSVNRAFPAPGGCDTYTMKAQDAEATVELIRRVALLKTVAEFSATGSELTGVWGVFSEGMLRERRAEVVL